MKIIFLDFDGVITTLSSRWCIDSSRLSLLMNIVEKTNSKIVVISSWKNCYHDVEDFKKSLFDEVVDKCNPSCYDCIEKDIKLFKNFLDCIYGITDNKGSWRGDEVERWINAHEDEIESYVILDDDSDFHEDQLFNFVQTDTFEGLTEREVKLCVARLNGKYINNPIRMNLELITRWRNNCNGIEKNNIEQLWSKYNNSIKK